MTCEEANKIIAEFMGYKWNCSGFNHVLLFNNKPIKYTSEINKLMKRYSESLDALVPVWEKLGNYDISLSYSNLIKDENERNCCEMSIIPKGTDKAVEFCTIDLYRTIQESACIETAKAIKELK